jgi:hypothetical protein
MSKRLIMKNKLRGLYMCVFRYVFFGSFFHAEFVEVLDPALHITNFNY